MDILHERVAGLDVHKDTVVACVRILAEGNTRRECRSFATTTDQLMELRTWLEECRCTQVAMEATGVYWMLARDRLSWWWRMRRTSRTFPGARPT